MNFDNINDLILYLKELKELGSGSQGTVYYDKKKKKTIKIYDSVLDYDEYTLYKENEILRFGTIKNGTYIFPDEVVKLNNQVIGYISRYVSGKSLYMINPLLIKLDNFSRAIKPVINDTKIITDMDIATHDVMYNIMYGNNKFHIIDTDEYSYSIRNYEVLFKHNILNFDLSIKYFLVDNLFDEFVYDNKLLKEMYNADDCSSLDFLKAFRKLLSEYSDQNVDNLAQVKQYVNKKPKQIKFIRF